MKLYLFLTILTVLSVLALSVYARDDAPLDPEMAKQVRKMSKLDVMDLSDDDLTDQTYQAKVNMADLAEETTGRPYFDASKLTTSDILKKFGLDHLVPNFVSMLDHANGLFTNYTQKRYINAVNRVAAAFKTAFLQTLEPAKLASPRPSGTLDVQDVKDLFAAQKRIFHDLVAKELGVDQDQVEPFFKQYVDPFYASLNEAYSYIYSKGLSLNWMILFFALPYIDDFDTNVIDSEMFAHLRDMPGQMKQTLHDFLTDILSGSQAHFIRMIISILSTFDFKKLMSTKDEL